jgi:hypothetical protein
MAYGLLLYKQIETPVGTQRLEIHKDGYAGSAVEIAGLQRDGLSISKDSDNLAQAVTTSVLTISLNDCGEVDYSQFFTPNSTLFKVIWKTKVSSSWETRWAGFITPDSFTENLAYKDLIKLTARDNLGRLSDYDFDLPQGQLVSVRSLLTTAMSRAGVAMGLTFTTTKVATVPATILAVDGLVNTTLLQGMTWRAAIELLLTGLGMTLAWNDGNSFEIRDITQGPATAQTAFFIEQSGYRQIRPAWKNLTIEQDYGLRDNFYEGQFSIADTGGAATTTVDTFTPPSGHRWVMTGNLPLLNPYNGIEEPSESIFPLIGGDDDINNAITYSQYIAETRRPVTIGMSISNCYWKWGIRRGVMWDIKPFPDSHQSTHHLDGYTLRFRFNVFLTYGGTKYVLRDNWEVYDPSTIDLPYISFLMPWTREGTSMEDVSIEIGSIPEDGLLEFVIYKPLVYLFNGDETPITPTSDCFGRIANISFTIGDASTGKKERVAINAQHNIQDSIFVQMGQVPPLLAGPLHFLGGLFYTNDVHSPLEAFARASGGTTYNLLELVGREYISYQNDNYNALSGSMMAEAALRFDKAVTYSGSQYRIVGASLAILSNTLNVNLLQQEASFDTTEYTIETINNEGGSSIRTGTSSVGQGSAASPANYFEEDGEGGIKLKDVYSGLWANGFMSAGGLNPGSGGGGGIDLDRVWESLTNNTDKPDVKIHKAHIPIATANDIGGVMVDGTTILINAQGVISAVAQGGGSVNSLTVGNTNYQPDVNGLITIPAYPTALPSPFALTFGNKTYDGSAAKTITAADLGALTSVAFGDLTTHPTTIAGYGITDAKIANGVITLGNNTITPLTSVPKAADSTIGGFQTGYTESGKKYAVKMSGNKAYVEVPWTDTVYSLPLAASGTRGGIQVGYTESGKKYAVQLSSEKAYVEVPWTDTVYTHPTGGANKTITAEAGKVLSAITVNDLGHVTSVAAKTLAATDIPDLSSSYLPISGGTLTGDLRIRNGNYGRSLFFGDGSYVYLNEDTDDHLKIYADKGLELATGNNYGITLDNNLTLNSGKSLTLGSGVLTWDSTHSAWKLTGNLYATGFISAGGVS